jgi:hypothetical protein
VGFHAEYAAIHIFRPFRPFFEEKIAVIRPFFEEKID